MEHTTVKTSAAGTVLSRLLTYLGGLKKKNRRTLLSSVMTSVLTYGILTWADALTQEARSTCFSRV